jgi:hypothetical protein
VIVKVSSGLGINKTPESFALHPPYPNPFNPITHIQLDIPRYTEVNLVVYNIQGRKAAVLHDGFMKAGYNTISWNAGEMSSGVYIIRMNAAGFQQECKALLLK